MDTRYYTGRPNDDKLPVELGEANLWSSFGHDNHDLNSLVMPAMEMAISSPPTRDLHPNFYSEITQV